MAKRTLLAGAVLLLAACSDDEPAPDRSVAGEVVAEDTPREGWKTIEYQSVRVAIPESWMHTDMSACGPQFEHWGASPSDAECGEGGGVSFFRAVQFETQDREGVRRARNYDSRGVNGVAFAGHVFVGDWAVYVGDAEKALVADVLASVEG